MARLHTTLFLFAAASVLAGCSTPPLVLDRTHPASVDAPEASTAPARSTLRADEKTRLTRELLKQREQQAKAAEAEPPVDQTYINPNAPKPAGDAAPAAPAKPAKMPGHENH